MPTLEQRASDTAERIMQAIEDRRCIMKDDLVREILATLKQAEADFWSEMEPSPRDAQDFRPSHYFRVAARLYDRGSRELAEKAMQMGFEIMLGEGRLTKDEFRALMLQYYGRYL